MRKAILALILTLFTLPALATVPLRVPLQGVIRDNAGVTVVEDVFSVTFSLYDGPEAVDPVWTESWPADGVSCEDEPSACVHVIEGRFRVALGAHAPLEIGVLQAADGLWLGMSVEGEPELPRRPLGSSPYALLASHATHADTAGDLTCTGCISPDALSNETVLDLIDTTLQAVGNAGYINAATLSAGVVPFDGTTPEMSAGDVQSAIEELKALIEEKTAPGSGAVNEGAGQVVALPMSETVPSYGSATQYVHLVNPSQAKVVTHLYGNQNTSGGGAGNLVVAYDFTPNQYSAGASGDAGSDSLHVGNPSLFDTGSHVMIHQTVGGSGTDAGTWEVSQVLAVNGNNLQLVKPLENAYVSDDAAKAQVVLAASFSSLEVVGGGTVAPAEPLAEDGSRGGIVYIRANQISVKSGGVIHADGAGHRGGAPGLNPGTGNGDTGGGSSDNYCGAAGGGGNQAQGAFGTSVDNCGGTPGSPGGVNPDSASALFMGGGGGGVQGGAKGGDGLSGGAGGGLVVLGAKSLNIAPGARIGSRGAPGSGPGAGGGAGGTVALFAESVVNEGDLDAAGGTGGTGQGEVFSLPPFETSSTNHYTYNWGAGYSAYHDEFWYPEWSGNTAYKFERTPGGSFNSIGSFNLIQSNLVQIWPMPDGGYLMSRWGYGGEVYRASAPNGFEMWSSQYLEHDSGGVCFDGTWVWSMHKNNNTLYQLDPDTGSTEDTHNLSSVNGTTYGGLVCASGRLYRMRSDGCMDAWDLDTKAHLFQQCGFIGAENTAFDGSNIYISNGGDNGERIRIVQDTDMAGGAGGAGFVRQAGPIAGVVNESFPKGVRLIIDGNDVTSSVGDPNNKGAAVYDAQEGWGATGLDPWSTGPLDVTNVANWTLGEHTIELKETGGAGGNLKAYTYVIYPFTESTPPVNDTCSNPVVIEAGPEPVVLSATTEDTMGKTLATDANHQPGCGGQGGPDVVYRVELAERSLLHAAVVAPFPARMYLRDDSCVSGAMIYCADQEFTTNPIEAGDYHLFVDSNAPVAKGDFTLAVSTTPAVLPANDTCASAETLDFVDGVAQVNATSIYALDQIQGFCAGQGGGPDVYYTFEVPAPGGLLNVQATGDFDPVLVLMKNACDGNDQFLCNPSGQLESYVQPGTYWLAVDGPAEKAWGDYSLTVTLQ